MSFTQHAIYKLELFCLSFEDVLELVSNPLMKCVDSESGALIALGFIEDKLYCVVFRDKAVITVYRTDEKRLNSRIRSGRWKCS